MKAYNCKTCNLGYVEEKYLKDGVCGMCIMKEKEEKEIKKLNKNKLYRTVS